MSRVRGNSHARFLEGKAVVIPLTYSTTSGRIFSALAHANVNVRMIDQGSSELNIIIGVRNHDFDNAIKAIYDIFVMTQL